MKHTFIILTTIALLAGGCGQTRKKQAENKQDADNMVNGRHLAQYTVEDSVRYQIGGKLYYMDNIDPSDSITVIKTMHDQGERDKEAYREYHFITHNCHSRAHLEFETATLDSKYKSYMNDKSYRIFYEKAIQPQLDAVPSKIVDTVIKNFEGYWVYLKEYNGNYYLDYCWDWRLSFCIADNIFTILYMDGPAPQKILEAISLPQNGVSILFGNEDSVKIEVVDKDKCVYRLIDKRGNHFIAPTRAIHNLEIIQYVNNTGNLI